MILSDIVSHQPSHKFINKGMNSIIQIDRYDPKDVKHIIPTHLDVDHAGGLADFPDATVHVLQAELDQILKPTFRDRLRFQPAQFDHDPIWKIHTHPSDQWFGFSAIKAIPEITDDILMIPLPGHTRGHTGVAVRLGMKWILHCGDAYYHHSQVTATPSAPIGSMFFQIAIAAIPGARVKNLARLRALALSNPEQRGMLSEHQSQDRFTRAPEQKNGYSATCEAEKPQG